MEAEEANEARDKRRRWSGPDVEWMDSHGRDMGDERKMWPAFGYVKLHCCAAVAVCKSIGACPVVCESVMYRIVICAI